MFSLVGIFESIEQFAYKVLIWMLIAPKTLAKITLNPIIERVQGKMGSIVFRRSHTGEMSITKLPNMSNAKWSRSQQAHRQRFKQAVAYAKATMVEPTVRAVYTEIAAHKHKRSFDMAVSDYFRWHDLL